MEETRIGRPLEVFLAFLRLGLTSFGGPIAHLGYYRQAFVEKRGWLTEAEYADLVALCQFLPGPASSQTGFAIGLHRAGWLGGCAAWIGFTTPSAILMTALALGAAALQGPVAQGAIHGLKIVAVAVVAQAVLGMARSLTPDLTRAALALAAAAIALLLGGALGQVAAIALGAAAGLLLCRAAEAATPTPFAVRISRRAGLAALAIFLLLLGGLPLLAAATGDPAVATASAFYRSGALVFGGGHVVLPLLEQAVVDPGLVGEDAFLAGYGAAQAMPGPIFTFGAYLGALLPGPQGGLAGAALGLVAIFLPGLLLLVAALPFWSRLAAAPVARAGMRGANAAVVGILAAALYDPVWAGGVADPVDAVAAIVGFALLTRLRAPPLLVVLLGLAFGVARAQCC